jgi:long-chain acyl-CoA synthetase
MHYKLRATADVCRVTCEESRLGDSVIQDHADIVATLLADDGPFALREVAVAGRTVRVYAQAARNVTAIFDQAEEQFAARDLAADEERRWIYSDVFARARCLAGVLQHQFGVRPGDRVGLVMRNRSEWFISFVAVIRAGGIATLFNSRGAAVELAAAAADVGCSVFIADGKRAALLRESDSSTPIILINYAAPAPAVVNATSFEEAIAGETRKTDPVVADPETPAVILFTSGTTGRPKGAVLTQRNITNFAANLLFLGAAGLTLAAKRFGVATDVLRQMVPPVSTLLVFPLFHISGLTAFFQAIQVGGMLTTVRRWRADAALPLISANRITMLSGPPLILADLLDQPGASEHLTTINHIGVGGQATPVSLITRVAKALPMAAQGGGWGMTEVTGSATSSSGPVFAARPTSAGRLSPLLELRVVDDEGHDVPTGAAGELWLRGSLIMQGYWNAPEATAAAFEDDWYKTGDVGFVDSDGFVFIIDRKKDMLICGGENIYCAEVERVLSSDEAFLEVSLFGIPDDRLGERAIAAVTLREGHRRTEEAVKKFARASLADYKVPSEVVFDLGPFPRNATSKIDKAKLRAAYLERLHAMARAGRAVPVHGEL